MRNPSATPSVVHRLSVAVATLENPSSCMGTQSSSQHSFDEHLVSARSLLCGWIVGLHKVSVMFVARLKQPKHGSVNCFIA